jgi:alanyl-tRNA synthetase
LHFDFGIEYGCGPDCEPSHDCGRFLEICNLVFMTYMRHEDGSLTPLPQKNIDTGAGLERVARAVQNVPSTYETDGLRQLLDAAAGLVARRYGEDPEVDRALRVIVDHSRAVSFLIADGVLPSNEGRGYVLRRVLRRAVYFGRTINMPSGFMEIMAERVLERYRDVYPYRNEQHQLVRATVAREERAFRETLDRGLTILEQLLSRVTPGTDSLPGEEVYRLYETYGVPKELTAEVAAKYGLHVDEEGFEQALQAAREISRSGSAGRFVMQQEELADAFARLAGHGEHFTGYDRASDESHITGLIREHRLVERADEGEEVFVILSATPFYPEGGGQVGDAGQITSETGRVEVIDTRRDGSGVIYHIGRVVAGYLSVQDEVRADVDLNRRRDVARNHTGTHLLHASLRAVLGEQVHQQGSLVAPERLRFDYNYHEATSPDDLARVRELVNAKVRSDVTVRTRTTSLERARTEGAMAIFGEKYGDQVRVVEIDGEASGRPFSAELCGGTHVRETGEIGGLFIISEGSIGSGLRRIEALTGANAERWIADQIAVLGSAAQRLGVSPSDLEQKILALQDELSAERRRVATLQRQMARRQAEALASTAKEVDGASVLVAQVDVSDPDGLRQLAEELRRMPGPSLLLVLGAVVGDRPHFVVMTRDLGDRVHAGKLMDAIAKAADARGGGGRPDFAQGAGARPEKLSQALSLAERLGKEQLSR